MIEIFYCSKTIKNQTIDVYKYYKYLDSKNIIIFKSMIFTNISLAFKKGIFFMKIAKLHFEF